MDSEKITLQDPLVTTENGSFFKRHLKLILFLIGAIVIITIVVVLIVVLTRDKDKGKDPDDDTPEEEEAPEEEEDTPEEDKYGLSLEELKRRTDPKYLGTKTLLKKRCKRIS